MKFVPGFLAVLALSSTISLSAAAAGQPITVVIDQQKLTLTTNNAPIKENNSILVPMRPIFEKLGMNLVWDATTSTITATKEGLTIKLQVGSKKASVNGTVKTLVSAPKMIKNVTYVPLRFVTEATGNSVVWNAKSNTVEITSKQTGVNSTGISDLFDQYVTYSNQENYDGFMSLIDSKSPFSQAGPAFKEQMEKYDATIAVVSMDIIDLQANEATVHTVETTKKTGGAFMLNDISEYVYLLTKDTADSKWKINNVQIQAVKYELPEGALKAAVTVPKADEDLIKAVFQANLDYTSKEDLNGVLSTLDENSPAYAQNKQIYSQIFQAYDLQYTLENVQIINYTADEAFVYAVQTTKKLKGPEFNDNRATTVTTVKKGADGKWKLVQTYSLGVEALTK